jgi:hypothetical protein
MPVLAAAMGKAAHTSAMRAVTAIDRRRAINAAFRVMTDDLATDYAAAAGRARQIPLPL